MKILARLILALFAAGLSAAAPADIKIPQQSATMTPTWPDVIVSPAANSMLGFDGTKKISNVTAGSGLTLASGSLSVTSGTFQPLNTNLSSVGALSNAAGWLHNDGAGVFTYSTPTYSQTGAAPAFTSGAANFVWATPNGAAGVPSLRSLVVEDIPFASPGAIGGATPAAGNFTTITTSAGVTAGTVSAVAALRALSITGLANGTQVSVAGYYAAADGGGGPVRVLSTGQAPGTYTDNGGSIIVPTGGNGSAAWLWQWSGPVNVRWFGVRSNGSTDDAIAFQAAANSIPATGGILTVPDSILSCVIGTQITFANPTVVQVGSVTMIGPSTGYLFSFNANGSGIEGSGDKTILKATTGCAGVVLNNQAMRSHYWNFAIDPNNVQSAKLFYHDGGWYVDVKNLSIDKATTHATTNAVAIRSQTLGVPGPTGSYGGAYTSVYTNVVAASVNLTGAVATAVTTISFRMLDTERVTGQYVQGVSFVNCAFQATGGEMIFLKNAKNISFIGGWVEGTANLYDFWDSSNITSIGNDLSSLSGLYCHNSGGEPLPYSSIFLDDVSTGTRNIYGNVDGLQIGDGELLGTKFTSAIGSPPLRVVQNANSNDLNMALCAIGNNINGAALVTVKTRSTTLVPTATVAVNDSLLDMRMFAADGTDFIQKGGLNYVVRGTVAAGRVPTRFLIRAAKDAVGSALVPTASFDPDTGMTLYKVDADPANSNSDSVYIFLRDNGAGKMQLCARFPSGAVVPICIEP
jgi:hypothetical protein